MEETSLVELAQPVVVDRGARAIQAPVAGTLYLAPPLSEAQRAIRAALRGLDAGYEELRLGTIVVRVTAGQLGTIGAALAATLSAGELAETQALFIADGAVPDLPDLLRSQPLSRLIAGVRGERVKDLLRDGRLATHFQPIVYADSPRVVFGHECLTRGLEVDGALVPADRLFADATASGLLTPLDDRARSLAIRTAAGLIADGHLFVNCSPTALCAPRHDCRALLALLADAGIPPGRLVLEIIESEAIADPAHLIAVLDEYRAAGVLLALDDLGAGHSSFSLLAAIQPDFIKLDQELVRHVDRSPLKATFARKLLEAAREAGIRVIAEGVETIAEWRWLRLYGAELAQGYLFAAPGNPPPLPRDPLSVLGEAPSPSPSPDREGGEKHAITPANSPFPSRSGGRPKGRGGWLGG